MGSEVALTYAHPVLMDIGPPGGKCPSDAWLPDSKSLRRAAVMLRMVVARCSTLAYTGSVALECRCRWGEQRTRRASC